MVGRQQPTGNAPAAWARRRELLDNVERPLLQQPAALADGAAPDRAPDQVLWQRASQAGQSGSRASGAAAAPSVAGVLWRRAKAAAPASLQFPAAEEAVSSDAPGEASGGTAGDPWRQPQQQQQERLAPSTAHAADNETAEAWVALHASMQARGATEDPWREGQATPAAFEAAAAPGSGNGHAGHAGRGVGEGVRGRARRSRAGTALYNNVEDAAVPPLPFVR